MWVCGSTAGGIVAGASPLLGSKEGDRGYVPEFARRGCLIRPLGLERSSGLQQR